MFSMITWKSKHCSCPHNVKGNYNVKITFSSKVTASYYPLNN